MQEFGQLIALIATLVTVVLKAIISNKNALPYSPFSLSGNPFFSIHSIWSGTTNHESAISAASISFVPTHTPVITLPRCTPADYNSTLLGFVGYKHNDWASAHNQLCTQDDSFSTTRYKPKFDIFAACKFTLKNTACLARKICERIIILTKIVSTAWSSQTGRRVRDFFHQWAVSMAVFLEYLTDPDALELLTAIHRALERLGRKGASVVGSRRRKTARQRYILHRRYRYYPTPYIITTDLPNGAYSLREMPLIVHSFLGHGVVQIKWHITSTLYSPDDMMPAYIELTEYLLEIRLPHCVRRRQSCESSRKLGAQWTHHVEQRIACRMDCDEWTCIFATRDEVYYTGDGYTETKCTVTEYLRDIPQEV